MLCWITLVFIYWKKKPGSSMVTWPLEFVGKRAEYSPEGILSAARGASKRHCWASAGAQGNVLSRVGPVLVTPDSELSLGVGDRALSLWKFLLADLSKTFCPQVLSTYTSKVSLYSFFLQGFYPSPHLLFLLLFSSFLQKTWFFDSLAVYSSICVPLALHPVGLDTSLPVSAAKEI